MSATSVFVGVWKNHSSGVLTLTLRDREAGILSASLVLFVNFVASQAWNIVKFILHQIRAGDIHNQYQQFQQLILRNTTTYVQALWLTAQLAWGWRRRIGPVAALKGSLLLLTVSFVLLAGWSAAQLFLSLVWTAAGDQFLVASDVCGWVIPRTDTMAAGAQVWFSHYKNRLETASTYQAECYGSRPLGASECRKLPVPRINWIAADADCPFADHDLCISTNSTPISMDSGYINSNAHLGANAAFADTIEYRKVATCSPIRPDFVVYNSTERMYHYYYGRNFALNTPHTFTYLAPYSNVITGYQIMHVATHNNPRKL